MNPFHGTPKSERPRERCLRFGAECLSFRECLALLLGTGPRGVGCLGLAEKILNFWGEGLPEREREIAFFTALESSAPASLKKIPGLGNAQLGRILSAFELGRRYAQYRIRVNTEKEEPGNVDTLWLQAYRCISPEQITSPTEWLGFIPFLRQEQFGELCVVARGTRLHVNLDPAELFARMLALRPKAFFLVHNHPSGALQPSDADVRITFQVREIAHALGVRLLGHWIVACTGSRRVELPADYPLP